MNLELVTIIESFHNSQYSKTRKKICMHISNKMSKESPHVSVCIEINCPNCICWGGYAGTYGRTIVQIGNLL